MKSISPKKRTDTRTETRTNRNTDKHSTTLRDRIFLKSYKKYGWLGISRRLPALDILKRHLPHLFFSLPSLLVGEEGENRGRGRKHLKPHFSYIPLNFWAFGTHPRLPPRMMGVLFRSILLYVINFTLIETSFNF